MGITYIANEAATKCSQGIGESTVIKAQNNDTMLHDKLVLTVTDSVPYTNIQPFSLCKSPKNPSVIANDMKPSTCNPMICMPWLKGQADFTIKGEKVLNSESQVVCMYGGVIEIIDDAQRK